jgi:hypothetical protein
MKPPAAPGRVETEYNVPETGSRKVMLRSMRKARFGQFALMLAGFLAISGAFGLHPEPEPAQAAAAAAGSGWHNLDRTGETNPHVCVACLSHRSISLPRLAAVVLQPASAVAPTPDAAPSPLGRLEVQSREGRAPPALL